MTRLVFFAHDAWDAAVQRRVRSFADLGLDVVGFTMRRGPTLETPWPNVDLGRTYDASFAQRIWAIVRALPILARHRRALGDAEVSYARNLDMLLLAQLAQWIAGGRARVVYECLDVHRFLGRSDFWGMVLRRIERRLLLRTTLVVVSSPAFCREYFDVHHPTVFQAVLLENKLPRGYDYGSRPAPSGTAATPRPIRIGWFGNLRCRRSLQLLMAAAEQLPERVQVVLRGIPARTEIPDFEARLEGRTNVLFQGRYSWPADLACLYRSVDLVWAGDFHDPGANSAWLLPNRLYEGGYYGVPSVSPAACETGRWLQSKGLGFVLPEPLEHALPAFLRTISVEDIHRARDRLLAAPLNWFVQEPEELEKVLSAVLASPRTSLQQHSSTIKK